MSLWQMTSYYIKTLIICEASLKSISSKTKLDNAIHHILLAFGGIEQCVWYAEHLGFGVITAWKAIFNTDATPQARYQYLAKTI